MDNKRHFGFIIVLSLAFIILTACDNPKVTYMVRYNGNGNTEGSIPSEQVKAIGSPLTLQSNSGSLAKEGYSYSGWNTQSDGKGTTFAEGAVYTQEGVAVLYAKWTALTSTITYNGNENTAGTIPEQQIKAHRKDLTLSGNNGDLEKAGLYFDCWNTAEDGSGTDYLEGENYTTDEDLVLYAKWSSSPTYRVVYQANDASEGTIPERQTKRNGSALMLRANVGSLTRTGYTFAGWNTQADGTGTSYEAGSSYEEDSMLTLYAKWTANTYTVTFDYQGGTGSPASKDVAYAATYEVLPTPTKAGFTFDGWYTEANGKGTKILAATNVTTTEAQTLYANWTESTYSVIYKGNENTSGTAPSSQAKTNGTSLVLSTNTGSLARTGYTFAGWNTKADGTGTSYATGASYQANAALTLYAKWTANTYTISFNSNGGSSVSNKTVTYDSTYGTLTTPTKTNYTFDGWYLEAAFTNKVTETTKVSTAANHTLYAKWTGKAYAVTFDYQDGSGSTPTKNVNYGSTYGELPTATRKGYDFGGWYTSTNGSGSLIQDSTTVTLTSNQILYAKWLTKTFTITYNGNGNTSGTVPTSQTKITGGSLTLRTNSGLLKKTDYIFAGWNTKADGTGANYASGSTYTEDESLTLYANWTASSYADGFFNTKFYSTQCKDEQWSTTSSTITMRTSGNVFNAVGNRQLTSSDFNDGSYIQFEKTSETGYYSQKLYASDGSLKSVLSNRGTINYFGDYGFLYKAEKSNVNNNPSYQYCSYYYTVKGLNADGTTPYRSTFAYTYEQVKNDAILENFGK